MLRRRGTNSCIGKIEDVGFPLQVDKIEDLSADCWKINNKIFVADLKNIKIEDHLEVMPKCHSVNVETRCRIEIEKIHGCVVGLEPLHEAGEHDIAGIAIDENNLRIREDTPDQSETNEVERIFVDNSLTVDPRLASR